MTNEFIPYNQALELKELGFNEPCFATYEFRKLFIGEFQNSLSFELCEKTEVFPAPTFSQAFRWFREKHNFISEIKNCTGADQNQWYYMIHHNNQLIPWRWVENKSYEEAELACLIKLIEIVKNKKS